MKHDFIILFQLAQSNDVFPCADNFLELVDSESKSKALSILSEFNTMAACELTMRTLYSPEKDTRLAETNMELLDKKEALVPLFGDLDSALIEHNETPLLAKIFEEEYDVIHFDFSGVGEISEEGVSKFINFLQKLDLMGFVSSVVAIKPNHAFYLNKSSIKMKIEFQNSLSKVLKKSNCVT